MSANESKANYLRLQDALCEFYNVSWAEVRTADRHENLSIIRRAYCFMARVWFNRSYSDIARDINRTNHATAMHHLRTFRDRLESYSESDMDVMEAMSNRCELRPNMSGDGEQ